MLADRYNVVNMIRIILIISNRTHARKTDTIMMEAENLVRLRESQTPLLGGDNLELHPLDFSGVTPKGSEIQTPNPIVTPKGIGMTLSSDVPKGTPLRDELHINEDIDMHDDSMKLEVHRQARNLRSCLTSLPQPKNEYQIVIQPIPEDDEESEDKIEEDMSDQIAREKVEEAARQHVLQRELPRPPTVSLELMRNSLMRADEESFVPPNVIELADEMIRNELLTLLDHDNADKVDEEKKIEDLEEAQLKEADSLIREEVQFLPTHNVYGLSSVTGSLEKLAALQNEFENVKKRMDDKAKKAQPLEQKIRLLTHGYQMRGGKLWSQIEATFKQMDTAATELECFQALQKQEHLGASYRTNTLLEETRKQKELEQNLQHRYGLLIAQKDKIEKLLEEYRVLDKYSVPNLIS